jgi:plasmid stability protein
MPTLYVENVPRDLYHALRARARKNRSSIAAEVIALLKDNVPTAAELKRRRQLYDDLAEMRSHKPPGPGPFPSTEEMIREDRER